MKTGALCVTMQTFPDFLAPPAFAGIGKIQAHGNLDLDVLSLFRARMVWSGCMLLGVVRITRRRRAGRCSFQIGRLKWDLPFFRERLASLLVRLLMETTWTSLSFSKAFM